MFSIKLIHKPLAFILIISLLAFCGSAHKNNALDQHNLTPQTAKNSDWNKRKIMLVQNDGSEHEGNIAGWVEKGFIVNSKDTFDTLAYDALCNYLLVDTGKKNKAIRFGICELASAAVLTFIARLILHENEDGNNATDADALPLLISLPVVILIPAGSVSLIIGLTSGRYEKYYYNKDDFAREPYIYKGTLAQQL